MGMTVEELISRLQQIKDKEKQVLVSGESALVSFKWHEHVLDQPHRLTIRT